MEMKIYKIDQIRNGNIMALIRIFEIEVLNFGSSKTSITHSSKPVYLIVRMDSHTIDFFRNAAQNKLNVSFDLKEHFYQEIREVKDEFHLSFLKQNIHKLRVLLQLVQLLAQIAYPILLHLVFRTLKSKL